MKPVEILPSHIYGEDFLSLDQNYLNSLKASIELMRKGHVNGEAVSNFQFGWQSNNLPHSGLFEKLTQKITKTTFLFCKNIKNFKFKKVEMQSFWANINYKGDINWPHKHQGDIAGVYYIDTHEDCGNLVLDCFTYNQNCKLSSHLGLKEKKIVVPKNDKIVLFDSSCMHFVTKNKSDKTIISMSFNVRVYD